MKNNALQRQQQRQLIGYRAGDLFDAEWCPLPTMREFEQDLGNEWFDDAGKDSWLVLWVTHNADDARRYGDNIAEIDLADAVILLEDGDGGYLYGRSAL